MDPREWSGSHRLREVEQTETRLEVPVAEAPVGEVGAAETPFAVATAGRGVRYHYVVTAVDRATPPNESGRSEQQSEILPFEGAAPEGGAPPGRPP